MKFQVLFLFIFMFIETLAFGQCQTFNTDTENWQVLSANLNRPITNPVDPGSQNYLQANDQGGQSYLFNNVDFGGDIHQGTDKNLSFDFRVFNDGFANSNPNVSALLNIYNGNIANPTSRAVFRLNTATVVNQTTDWGNFTVPIYSSTGNQTPSNNIGFWQMYDTNNNIIANATVAAAAWDQLIVNATGIYFKVDIIGSSEQTEIIAIDNVCICNLPNPTFHLEDDNGVETSAFYCGDVYLDGTASQLEQAYSFALYRRPIGSNQNFSWVVTIPWNWQTLGTVNLSDLSANAGHVLETGYEYKVLVGMLNWCGWNGEEKTFTIANAQDPSFLISGSSNYAGEVVVNVLSTNPAPTGHWWDIFHESPNGPWADISNPVPGNPAAVGATGPVSASFNANLYVNETYYVVHGIWLHGCFGWTTTSRSIRIEQRKASGGKTTYEIVYGDIVTIHSDDKESLIKQMEETKKGSELFKSDLSSNDKSEIQVFPNPANSLSDVQIKITDGNIKEVELLDLRGRQVVINHKEIEEGRSSFTLNESMTKGVYIVRVLTEDDKVIISKLLIQ